jgi:hypothetical protein
MSMKNSNDTIGNRTRDLPAGRAVPQPTAPPRADGMLKETKIVRIFNLQRKDVHANCQQNWTMG